MEDITFFISGHRDLTEEQFENHYVPEINWAITRFEHPKFVVGDCSGADVMAQEYLKTLVGLGRIHGSQVTVYHMFQKPRHLASDEFRVLGGFESDVERDSQMTKVSNYDIAYIGKKRWTSGTAQNILRRYEVL